MREIKSVPVVLNTNIPLPLFQDDNLDVTTYIVLVLEKNFVQISDLVPGTAYLFRVQALSSDSSPGGSSMEEQFETLNEGTEQKPQGKNCMCFIQRMGSL